MPQVIRVDEMKCLAGWDKVEELVKQKMIEQGPKLEGWTVCIRSSPKKDSYQRTSEMDRKKKILTVVFPPVLTGTPEIEADIIMREFAPLEKEEKMPKVIIARDMRDKDEKGWRKLKESLEQRMAEGDPKLKDWTVFIESRREKESQLAATRTNDEMKMLTVGFPLGPPDTEVVEIYIMAFFASLKKEGRL